MLQRAEQDWPPVVVCSVFQTGLNLMRDLERRGVRVVGVDCETSNEGFRSRYGKSYQCPNPDSEPEAWVAYMRSLARELKVKPVIIPAADIFVDALGRHADELAEDFNFSREQVAVQARLVTKEQQYALAASAGLPSPRFSYLESVQDVEEFCRDARFPCLLKPLTHREWEALPADHPLSGKKVALAETADEFRMLYRQVVAIQPKAIGQELIVGGDDAKFCYLSVYGSDGGRLGYCVVKEFRCHPIQFGSASIVEPVMDEEIADVCDRFLGAIGYVGICEIEVKRDARDGCVRLIEVNPRVSGTGDCAVYTGVETGWLHYLDRIGKSPEPISATRLNFRHITLQRDAPAFGQYMRAGLTTWSDWWRVYLGQAEYFDVDFRDWAVTRQTLYLALRALVGGVLRHWKVRR